jgi:hypothetical protein
VGQRVWLQLVDELNRIRDPAALPGWLAALREAFRDLPPSCRRLILLLLEDPPIPYAEINARLGIPAGSIGPTRRRCPDKLRRHPAIACARMDDLHVESRTAHSAIEEKYSAGDLRTAG